MPSTEYVPTSTADQDAELQGLGTDASEPLKDGDSDTDATHLDLIASPNRLFFNKETSPLTYHATRCGLYSSHLIIIAFVLFGWVLWMPFCIAIPITGITWELVKDCPCSMIERFYLGMSVIPGVPGTRAKLLLWIDMLVCVVVVVVLKSPQESI